MHACARACVCVCARVGVTRQNYAKMGLRDVTPFLSSSIFSPLPLLFWSPLSLSLWLCLSIPPSLTPPSISAPLSIPLFRLEVTLRQRKLIRPGCRGNLLAIHSWRG